MRLSGLEIIAKYKNYKVKCSAYCPNTHEMSDKCSLLLKFWLSEMMTQTKQNYFQLLAPFDTFLASLEILNVKVNLTSL